MQLELSKEQEHKLKAFSEEVIERNKQHNLTGYKNTQAFFDDQIVDCVLALKACKKNLQNKETFNIFYCLKNKESVIDE